jgi:hypothetical protein
MQEIEPQDVVVPAPLVTWEQAVAAYAPASEVTRQRYRGFRKNGRITGGVQAFQRKGSFAAGSSTYHSALVVIAAHAARSGDQKVAAKLVSCANLVEQKFGPQVKVFLAEHDLGELPTAEFYGALLEETSSALKLVPAWTNALYAAGRIESVESGWAQIKAVTSAGSSVLMDVPAEMLRAMHLSFGDSVLVFREMLKSSSAAIVELVPGASLGPVTLDDAGYGRYVESVEFRRSAKDVERIRGLVASGNVGRRTLRPAG